VAGVVLILAWQYSRATSTWSRSERRRRRRSDGDIMDQRSAQRMGVEAV